MKLLLIGVVFVGSAFSQTKQPTSGSESLKGPSIEIGMTLRLGMSRDAIVTQLMANYKIQKLQTPGDDWFVAEGSPMTWIGVLGFHEGKLTYASRNWTQGQEDNYEFAQALWGAMTQMSGEGQGACTFDAPNTRSPTAEIKYVRFYCGHKRIEVTATNVIEGEGKGHYARIDEVLSSETNR